MKTITTITFRQNDVHADNTCCAGKQCWNNRGINGVFAQHERWSVEIIYIIYAPWVQGQTGKNRQQGTLSMNPPTSRTHFDHAAQNAAYVGKTCCPCLPATPRTQAWRSPHSTKKSRQPVLHTYKFFSWKNMLHQPWCQWCLLITKQTSERGPVVIL